MAKLLSSPNAIFREPRFQQKFSLKGTRLCCCLDSVCFQIGGLGQRRKRPTQTHLDTYSSYSFSPYFLPNRDISKVTGYCIWRVCRHVTTDDVFSKPQAFPKRRSPPSDHRQCFFAKAIFLNSLGECKHG